MVVQVRAFLSLLRKRQFLDETGMEEPEDLERIQARQLTLNRWNSRKVPKYWRNDMGRCYYDSTSRSRRPSIHT